MYIIKIKAIYYTGLVTQLLERESFRVRFQHACSVSKYHIARYTETVQQVSVFWLELSVKRTDRISETGHTLLPVVSLLFFSSDRQTKR